MRWRARCVPLVPTETLRPETPPPRVVLTRPAEQAGLWLDALRARGWPVWALPLIVIAPVRQPDLQQALRSAWMGCARYQALMFVSANAVEHFFKQKPHQVRIQWSKSAINFDSSELHAMALPRLWATGPGTAQALWHAGAAAHQVDQPPADAQQFDSEALWQQVQPQLKPGARVLIVRGGDEQGSVAGRHWLAEQLAAMGVAVDQVVAYGREAPQWNEATRDEVRQAAQDGSVWLLSSTEALRNLQQVMPGQSWRVARAVATHPRIAAAARAAGFGVVSESRPTLVSVVASIESLE